MVTEELFFYTAKSRFVIICAFIVQFEPCMLLEKEDFAGPIKIKLCKLLYVQIRDDTVGHSSQLSWRCESS